MLPELGPLSIPVDEHLSVPLHRQVYEGVRGAILERRLKPGQRIPSSRAMAQELDLARGTVLSAYEQLELEGYLVTRAGSGTFVAALPPDDLLYADPASASEAEGQRPHGSISSRARSQLFDLPAWAPSTVLKPFKVGIAPIDAFPRDIVARLSARVIRSVPTEALGYGDPGGYWPLREMLADYLGAARAVRCSPEQVIITGGSQHAISLAAGVLLDAGDPVWIENPGYYGAYAAFVRAGLCPKAVPVDKEGVDVSAAQSLHSEAMLAYVTPSHQYPLGVTMSLSRRLELLRWAVDRNGWIIEDDYDSEFRYAGLPLASLHALDEHGVVLYAGTFSKVLAPALRLGYLVVPSRLVEAFLRTRAAEDRHPPVLSQMVIEQFIREGHFGRHLRRMRKLGHERAEALGRALSDHLPHLPHPTAEAGLHLTVPLPEDVDDVAVSERAARAGVVATPLSTYYFDGESRSGLVLGYAAFDEEAITRGVRALARAIPTEA